MHLWFACNTWRYMNVFWLSDWLIKIAAETNRPTHLMTHLTMIKDVCGNSLRGSKITGTETFDLAGINIAMVRGLGRMPSVISAARRNCATDVASGLDATGSRRSDRVKTSTSPSSSLAPVTRSATMSGGMSDGMPSNKDWALGYMYNGTSCTTAGTSAGFSKVNSDNCNKPTKPRHQFQVITTTTTISVTFAFNQLLLQSCFRLNWVLQWKS